MGKKRKTSILAIANQKGGVAKTTSVVQLADCFASMGNKVLVVDFDFQGNATDWFGLAEKAEKLKKTTAHAIMGSLKFTDIKMKTEIENVDLVASDLSLNYLMRSLSGSQKQFKVAELILDCEELDNYDLVIIDTHPAVDSVFESVMNFAHYYLIPIYAEKHPYKGVEYLLRVISEIKEYSNNNLFSLGIFITNFDKSATAKEYKKKLEALCIKNSDRKSKKSRNKERKMVLLDTTIRHSKTVKGASSSSQPMSLYTTRQNNIWDDYMALAMEIDSELIGKRTGRPQPAVNSATIKQADDFVNEFGGYSI